MAAAQILEYQLGRYDVPAAAFADPSVDLALSAEPVTIELHDAAGCS